MQSIHGHEVLEMLIGQSYTEQELLDAIKQKFGANAIFHTCSKEDMTAKELIDLLRSKGKFVLVGDNDKLTTEASKICQH